MTGLAIAIMLGGIALLAGEFAARWLGMGAFALFADDPLCRYRMRPAQSGRFRRRTDWAYDADGLRRGLDGSGVAGATLLIGDSVVDGGLNIDQRETVAACFTAQTGTAAHALACHGWSLANELAALEALAGWRNAGRLVFVLNSGDFDIFPTTHDAHSVPRQHPRLLLPWLIVRQLRRHNPLRRMRQLHAKTVPTLPIDSALRARNLEQFVAMVRSFAGPVWVAAFPYRDELGTRHDDATGFAATLAAASGAGFIDVAASPHWTRACYHDHVHPNRDGARALAAIIAQACC